MKLKCPRKDCGYEWEYKGKRKFIVCCPNCHGSVRIKQNDTNIQD